MARECRLCLDRHSRHYLPRPTMSGSYDRKCKHLRNMEISCRNARATQHSLPDIYRLFKNPNKLSSGR